jgi:hypothetical protein
MSELIIPSSTLEKPKGAVVGVAFEVALTVACIPLGREGKVLFLVELLYEVFAVTFGSV